MIRLFFAAVLTLGLATSALALDSTIKTLKVDRGLTAEAARCVECHAGHQPGIVNDWRQSLHGHVGVSCIDCHAVEKDSPIAAQNCPGVKGTATYVTVLVTPEEMFTTRPKPRSSIPGITARQQL